MKIKWIVALALTAIFSSCQQAQVSQATIVPYEFTMPDGTVLTGNGQLFGEFILASGDIEIPASARTDVISSKPKGNIKDQYFYFWPNGVIPYVFDSSVDATTQARVLEAFQPWTSPRPLQPWGVSIRPRTTESKFLTIKTNPSIGSWRCSVSSDSLVMTANPNCRRRDLVHEWGHVIGLQHENERSDRDLYIITNDRQPRGLAVGPYDFGSIMHYDAYGRNKDGSINYAVVYIQPRDGRALDSFGFNENPSRYDIESMHEIYPPLTSPPIITQPL